MLNNIQLLRAIAASLVVMQHSFQRAESYGLPAHHLLPLEGFGLSGVDIFFVISGFIMGYSNQRTPKSPKEFILHRIVRIVPLYWAWMVIIAGLLFAVPGAFRTLQFDFEHIVYSTVFLSQAVLNEPPFIDLGWTLEFELLFYVFFALTLFLQSPLRQRFMLGTAMLTFALVFVQPIVLEFLLGYAGFLLLPLVRRRAVAAAVALAGVAAFCVTHLFLSEIDRLFKWGVPAFLLVLGLAAGRGRYKRVSSYLGDASYSIYLVQVASIPLFYKIASIVLGANSDIEIWLMHLGDLLILGSIVFALIAGVMLHEIVEKPLTRMTRWLVLKRHSVTIRD
jgi:peptidoglycan/LPS O-acetylase OafA/YrhL